MKQAPTTALAALVCFLCLACCAGQRLAAAPAPTDLQQAQTALERNLALGASLAGRPATPEQVAEAKRLVEQGLDQARASLAKDPSSAEAHRLVGLLLCLAYRPVEVKRDVRDEKTGGRRSEHTTVLLQGVGEDAEEGLTELQAALRLDPKNADYQLDCAEAFLIWSPVDESAEQALATWEARAALTPPQRLRTARLLAEAMKRLDRQDQEKRWLREVLKQHPGDPAATQRLAQLAAQAPKEIVWQEYDPGLALASRERKPALIDFWREACGWCRKLDAEVFTNPDIIALSRQFVCIRVNGTKRQDLAARYQVPGFPTVVLLDSQGREVHRIVGFRPAPQFLDEMQRGLALSKAQGPRR